MDDCNICCAIAGINVQLYEAATIDETGRWLQMWHATLPGIRSTIVIMFILTLGQILTWGFDQVYNYNPLVYDTGDILDTYIFRTALADIRFSYARLQDFSDRLSARHCCLYQTML